MAKDTTPPNASSGSSTGQSLLALPNTPHTQQTLPTNSVKATPVTTKIASYEAYSSIPTQWDVMYQRLVSETGGHYIGPMPVKEFFDAFMPWNKDVPDSYKSLRPPKKRVHALKYMASIGESQMYGKFIEAFNNWPRHDPTYMHCRLRLKDSHSFRDKDCRNIGVDISGYSTPFVPRQVEQTMDFANAETWVELKRRKRRTRAMITRENLTRTTTTLKLKNK
ncbi:hypothetical protein NLJ89_g2154 [Agrocybe chaxingu]|uniref:Uncharacterized protein n=1 Tax=Agrocybe chaxingu TaxID=84603 RepID=A0A9W8KBF9_9AGAR|nr:hypothetical protein NLJ89_g2154 [Agrocybe chaxingu]